MEELHLEDYTSFENFIFGTLPSLPAVMSVTVVWTAMSGVNHYENPDQRFRGDFRDATAQIAYEGHNTQFEFKSAPLRQSVTDHAEFGQESNGAFF